MDKLRKNKDEPGIIHRILDKITAEGQKIEGMERAVVGVVVATLGLDFLPVAEKRDFSPDFYIKL